LNFDKASSQKPISKFMPHPDNDSKRGAYESSEDSSDHFGDSSNHANKNGPIIPST
jgi:hypothetical protein